MPLNVRRLKMDVLNGSLMFGIFMLNFQVLCSMTDCLQRNFLNWCYNYFPMLWLKKKVNRGGNCSHVFIELILEYRFYDFNASKTGIFISSSRILSSHISWILLECRCHWSLGWFYYDAKKIYCPSLRIKSMSM